MDHDDLWHPEHLQRLSQSLEEEPNSPAAVATKTCFQDGEAPQYSVGPHNCTRHDPWEVYPVTAFGPPSLALCRRSFLEAVDGWSPQHDGCGDYLTWLKLGLLGSFVVNESSTAAYRHFENSYSSELRGDQLLRYYGRHVDASQKALTLRENRGLDAEEYRQRFRVQVATLELLRILLPGEDRDVRRAAEQFDRNISGQPQRITRRVWGTFRWYVRPYVREIGRQIFSAQIIDLVDHWPYPDSQLRSMLREWAYSLTPAADLLSRYPWRPSCWRHLLGRGRKRIQSKIST
jgi:hypothetical protein